MKGLISRAFTMNGSFSIEDEDIDEDGSITMTISGFSGDILSGFSYEATIAYDGWTVEYEEEEYDLNGSLTEDYNFAFDTDGLIMTMDLNGTVTVSQGLSSSIAVVDLKTVVSSSVVTVGETTTVSVTATSTGTVNGKTINETYTLTASDA